MGIETTESAFYDYKHEKEAFVSNLNGTSVTEVLRVISVFPLAFWAQRLAFSALALTTQLTLSKSWLANCLFEYVTLCLPMLLSFTLMSTDTTVLTLYAMLTALGIVSAMRIRAKKRRGENPSTTTPVVIEFETEYAKRSKKVKLEHVTGFRSLITLATVIAILAVDFRVFPRRFGKAETFGTGLMDIGVGCFVLSNAIVMHSKIRTTNARKLTSQIVFSAVPLLVLGFGRLISTRGLEYQEHVTEYGVHWNFFFTLAFVSIGASIVRLALNKVLLKNNGYHMGLECFLGVLILVVYQTSLSFLGLQDWVLHAERTSIISMNKEGICSALGFLGLYQVGIWLGSLYEKPGNISWNVYMLRLWSISTLLWASFFVSDRYVDKPSRRLANVTYVLWVIAMSHQIIVMILSVLLFPGSFKILTPSRIVHSINRNQLVIFLIANVLTGLCNFTVKTMYASDAKAFAILNLYLLSICVFASGLHENSLTLKFW